MIRAGLPESPAGSHTILGSHVPAQLLAEKPPSGPLHVRLRILLAALPVEEGENLPVADRAGGRPPFPQPARNQVLNLGHDA